MALYDFDTEILSEQLTPPELRQPKQKAWLKVLLTPLQWFRDWFFNDYIGGQSYPDWDAVTMFNYGDKVTWTDKGVYLCIRTGAVGILAQPSGATLSTTFWLKIQDNFIGVNERVKYNSQMIVFAYALNRFFKIPSSDPQIFITTNTSNTSVFVMGETGPTSSAMASDSNFSTSYMANDPTFPGILPSFTISVPVLVFNSLGTTTQDRENAIRNFADKYKLAGTLYSVTTF